jgi:ATP-dependent protease ClpP protease subunit
MDKIKAIYKKHAQIPKKELNDILKHDLWWEADKCIQYGLVDEVWNRT